MLQVVEKKLEEANKAKNAAESLMNETIGDSAKGLEKVVKAAQDDSEEWKGRFDAAIAVSAAHEREANRLKGLFEQLRGLDWSFGNHGPEGASEIINEALGDP